MEWRGKWTVVGGFEVNIVAEGMLEIPKCEDRRIALKLMTEWVQQEGIITCEKRARIYSYHNLLPLLKKIPDEKECIRFKKTMDDKVSFNFY